MRRVLLLVALSAIVIGSPTACAGDPAAPPTPTSAALDETPQVCAEAQAAAAEGATEALARIDAILTTAARGDGVAVLQVGLLQDLDAWKTTLYGLRDREIRSEVDAVLKDTISYLDEVAGARVLDPADIRAGFTGLRDDLAEACR
jgi:hypothetical protein